MDLNNKRKKYVKIGQNTGSEKMFVLLDVVESYLEDDIDELMREIQTQSSYSKRRILKKMSFPMTNLKTFQSLKQTFTSLKIDGKIQRTVKKRVRMAELMSRKQKKNLKDSEKKRERKVKRED